MAVIKEICTFLDKNMIDWDVLDLDTHKYFLVVPFFISLTKPMTINPRFLLIFNF